MTLNDSPFQPDADSRSKSAVNTYEIRSMRSHATDAGLGDCRHSNTCAWTSRSRPLARQAIRSRAAKDHPGASILVRAVRRQIDPAIFAAMRKVTASSQSAEEPAPKTWKPAHCLTRPEEFAQRHMAVRESAPTLIDAMEGLGQRYVAGSQMVATIVHHSCIIANGRGNSLRPACEVVAEVRLSRRDRASMKSGVSPVWTLT